MKRCVWCNLNNEIYVNYHDKEWGVLNLDDTYLFEMLILELFQAGLSFECVLNKSAFSRLYHELLLFDIDADTDSIYFYSICSNCEKKKVTIGRKQEHLETKDDAIIIL